MWWLWLACAVTVVWLSFFRRTKDKDEGIAYLRTPYEPKQDPEWDAPSNNSTDA